MITNRLLLALFSLVLVLGVTIHAVVSNITDPSAVKSWLDEGGVYQSIPQAVLDMPLGEDEQTLRSLASKNKGLSEDDITQALGEALPPEYLKSNTETFIDSVGEWYRNDSEPLNYTLELSDREVAFKAAFKQIMTNFIDGLPVCSNSQLSQQNQDDLFSAECRPAGFNAEREANRAVNEMLGEATIFEDGISVEEPPFSQFVEEKAKGDNDQDGQSGPGIEDAFTAVKYYLPVLLIVLLVLSLLILATSDSWKRGARSMGTVLVVDGLLLLIAWQLIIKNLAPDKISLGGEGDEGGEAVAEVISNIITPVVNEIQSSVVSSAVGLSLLITALGTVILLWYYLSWHSHHNKHHSQPDKNSSTSLPSPKPKK